MRGVEQLNPTPFHAGVLPTMPDARLAARPPAPSWSDSLVEPSMLCVALAISTARVISGQNVSRLFCCISSAVTPVTCGAAKLVPESTARFAGPGSTISMLAAGATSSGFSRSPFCDVGSPKLEQAYIVSSLHCAVP